MEPLLESFLKTLDGLRALDPQTLSNVLAGASLLATVIFGVLGTLGLYHQFHQAFRVWRSRRVLEREFGADLYLPETIERCTRYYIRPDCSSVDPADEADLRSLVTSREDLFSVVDRFLEHESTHRHLLLLADSGMGKSSFVLNYYAAKRLRSRRKRQRFAVVPLGHPDAAGYIDRIEPKRETILLLDAFDEDPAAITDYRARLEALMKLCAPFRRVLLTCRTQFFPRAVEIPMRAGFVYDPREAGQSGEYEFRKLYLMPFTDSQVTAYLRRRFRWRILLRRRARRLVNKVSDLSVRPMLLAHLPELVNAERIPATAYDLYHILVVQWLQRERRWILPETLDVFSERLALNLHENRKARGAEWVPREEVPILARSWGIQVPSADEWMLTGRSLLNRDSEGRYKFAHRSILEYFLARSVAKHRVNIRTLEPTDQVRAFLRDSIEAALSKRETPDVWLIAYLFGDAISHYRNPAALFSSRLGLLGELRLDSEQRVFAATLAEIIANRTTRESSPSRILRMLEDIARGQVTIPENGFFTARELVTWWTQLATMDAELAIADAVRLMFDDRALRLSIRRKGELTIWDTATGLAWLLPVSLERPVVVDTWPSRGSLERGHEWAAVLGNLNSSTDSRTPTDYEILTLWLCLCSSIAHFRRILGDHVAQEVEMEIRASCDAVLRGASSSARVTAALGVVVNNAAVLDAIHETWPELLDSFDPR